MSGGSYNYIYSRLSEECKNRMYDVEMDDLIKDLCEVLHDLEWWQSCDSSEEEYRESLAKFKAKWFKDNRQERLKGYIDDQISIVRKQLYDLIGVPEHNKNGVLDKIKAEIDRQEKWLMSAGCNAYNVDMAFNSIKSVLPESEDKE